MKTTILSEKRQYLTIIVLAVIILFLSLYMVYWGTEKEGFYIDEMFSLMNIRGGGLDRPYHYSELFNRWYTGQELESTIGVSRDNAFTGIFSARSLYWSLLHIAYSFTPDEITAWPSVILNIIFFAGCLVVMYLLSSMFISNKYLALLPGLLWGLSSAAVNVVLYIRYYCLKTLICLLLTYVVFHAIKNGFNKWVYPAAIALLMCAGVFVHQYFFVFAFFLAAIVCFYLLFTKDFKSLFVFAGLMAAGAVVYELMTGGITGVLSSRVDEVTAGNRAEEAMASLFNGGEGYAGRIGTYLLILRSAVFAGINLYIILVVFIISAVVSYFTYKKEALEHGKNSGIRQLLGNKDAQLWLLMFSICLCYFLMISRIAPYQDYRYMFCIMPFIYILFVPLLVNVPKMFGFKQPLISFTLIALPCSILLVSNIENIYIKRDPGAKAVLEQYYHLPVICVNGGREQISRCYWLLFDFENEVLLTADKVDMDVAKEKSYEEGVIYMYPSLYNDNEMESFMREMGLCSRTHLLTLVRHSVYLLE